jgi:hypothetical protein
MSYHKTPLKYGTVTVDEFIPTDLTDVTVLQIAEYHWSRVFTKKVRR